MFKERFFVYQKARPSRNNEKGNSKETEERIATGDEFIDIVNLLTLLSTKVTEFGKIEKDLGEDERSKRYAALTTEILVGLELNKELILDKTMNDILSPKDEDTVKRHRAELEEIEDQMSKLLAAWSKLKYPATLKLDHQVRLTELLKSHKRESGQNFIEKREKDVSKLIKLFRRISQEVHLNFYRFKKKTPKGQNLKEEEYKRIMEEAGSAFDKHIKDKRKDIIVGQYIKTVKEYFKIGFADTKSGKKYLKELKSFGSIEAEIQSQISDLNKFSNSLLISRLMMPFSYGAALKYLPKEMQEKLKKKTRKMLENL